MRHPSHQPANRLEGLRFPQLPLELHLPADVPRVHDLKFAAPQIKSRPRQLKMPARAVLAGVHELPFGSGFAFLAQPSPGPEGEASPMGASLRAADRGAGPDPGIRTFRARLDWHRQ